MNSLYRAESAETALNQACLLTLSRTMSRWLGSGDLEDKNCGDDWRSVLYQRRSGFDGKDARREGGGNKKSVVQYS